MCTDHNELVIAEKKVTDDGRAARRSIYKLHDCVDISHRAYQNRNDVYNSCYCHFGVSSQHSAIDLSVHLPDQSINILLPIAEITALHEMPELPWSEASSGVAKLERPEEVVDLLEVRSNSEDLMDQILHAHNAVLAEVLLDDGVVGERDTSLVGSLGVSTLVDELANGLEVGVAVRNERFDDLEHLRSGLGQANEDTIVDLKETK